MSDVKTAYVHGAAVAKVVNPVGDNYVANFGRGFALYFDKDVAAKRNVGIEADKAACKQYLLSK